MQGALEGTRILEIGAYTTGPLCTRLLSNLGAEVIKVEPLKGEAVRGFAYKIGGISYIFHLHNYNKKGIALDTGTEKGKRIFLALAAKADILVENFAHGTMDKWGFSYDALRKVNEGLIYCSCSGFGHTGPMKSMRAFDTVIQGFGGVMSLTGLKEGPPTKIGISVADAMGSTVSAMAILGALRHKRKTGKGQHIDISMHDIMGWMTASSWPESQTGSPPYRDGNRHAQLAPQNIFQARDGLVAIAVENSDQLERLMDLIGMEDRALGVPFDQVKAHEEKIEAQIGAWAADRNKQEVVEACQQRKIPAGIVHQMADIAEHPHTHAREMIIEMKHSTSGAVKLLGSPFKMSATPGVVKSTAPNLGEHTREVLRDILYYSEKDITELAEDGIIP